MAWQQYNLTFRLLSPLHIGWRKSGNLQQSRGYVPGKNVWAGLTARLTRDAGQGAMGEAYVRMGQRVTENFRFTYLYPSLAAGEGYQPHYPWEEDFDYLFADSYTSTALNYSVQSAEEGMLHETECIAPHTRCRQPVYLTGTLFVLSNLPDTVSHWQASLPKLQFGGERGYGWGQVALCRCSLIGESGDLPVVIISAKEHITAHLRAENVTGVAGPVEPLVGWERNNNPAESSNWRLSSSAAICYAPGAIVTQDQTFLIGEYGILGALPGGRP